MVSTVSVSLGMVPQTFTHLEKNILVELAREEPRSTSFDQNYLMNMFVFSNRIWELRPVVVRKRRWRSLGLAAVSTINIKYDDFFLKMAFA